ncbi:MAG: PAS domain S-box protein [Candidatus Izimaplasma sp.]|nr:PAS domain S-box protein [Candidatus Izimaplasma bacterium]
MNEKQYGWLGIIIGTFMLLMLFVYNIKEDYHIIVAQLLLVQIIIGVIFYYKWVMPITIILIIAHVSYDAITLETFPVDAVFTSVIQLGVMFLLIYVLHLRKNLSKRLNNIIEATRIGSWEWNLKTNEVIVNDRWAEMLGYTKEELNPITSKTWESLTYKTDLDKSNEQIQKVFNKEQEYYDIEVKMKHKDGHYIWVNDRGKVTEWDKSGRPVLMSGTHTDITDKRNLKDKILYYHNLMDYVIDHMNSGIAVHDKDLNYIYVSKHYLEQYNIKEDIIGKHHYDVFPDLPQKWRDVHQKALKGEVLSADRDEWIREDGEREITRWECRPWYDEFGEIGGIIVYTEIINDFIKIEEELKKSKELLQAVMDNLPIGIAVNSVKPEVNFEYINDNFAKIYNTTIKALKEGDFAEVVYEDEKFRKEIKKKILADIASNNPDKMVWKDIPITKNGKVVKYVTAYNTPLPNRDLYISTVIDDTLRKKLEQSLEESAKESFIQKEKIEATLLAIGDAVISTDEFGKINAFNDIASEVTGFSKAEVKGKLFSDIFNIHNETTKKEIPCPVKRVLETGKTIHLENHTVLVTKTKEHKIIEDSAAPIRNQAGKLIGVILVFRDVTEKKQKQREIEFLSLHDYLTGLYNRRFFTEKFASLDSFEHYPLGVMMIDVNGLKIINDAYGHEVGDLVLKESAKSMMKVINDRGIVSRIGGDEFTVIVDNTSVEELENLKEKINLEISNHKIQNITLSVSIGYALKQDKDDDISEVLKTAENIMYKFKLADGASARNHTIQAILKTLTDKHALERTHSERVGKISKAIGKALKMHRDELTELEMSGLFHDIGKISIPDKILNKPGKLTKEEYEIIKEHTRNGYMILRAADEYSELAENALLHHEHFDGKGYPEGLKGEDIPLQARIICIADAYEAMTSNRPYRDALSVEQAKEELIKYKGTQFDPKLVDIFINKVLTKSEFLD